jgi:hypothetical protein
MALHQSFGTVRAGVEREPITFDFGLYGEDTFTVMPEPSLGDTFDLADAPEPSATNMVDSARVLARFIRCMLVEEDRPRFDAALHRIPASQAHVIVEAATWIAQQVSGFPTTPPASSSGGRRTAGTTSRKRPGGTGRSKR